MKKSECRGRPWFHRREIAGRLAAMTNAELRDLLDRVHSRYGQDAIHVALAGSAGVVHAQYVTEISEALPTRWLLWPELEVIDDC